jgi:hypothetical protein
MRIARIEFQTPDQEALCNHVVSVAHELLCALEHFKYLRVDVPCGFLCVVLVRVAFFAVVAPLPLLTFA